MNTRKANIRITIFSKTGGQNEDGEVINGTRNDVYSCWAEVSKTSVKDFKTGGKSYIGELSQDGQKPLESYKDTKVFIIRYHPRPPFDNSMYIEFYGEEYKINEMEIDYATKETILIKATRVS